MKLNYKQVKKEIHLEKEEDFKRKKKVYKLDQNFMN